MHVEVAKGKNPVEWSGNDPAQTMFSRALLRSETDHNFETTGIDFSTLRAARLQTFYNAPCRISRNTDTKSNGGQHDN
jgi:hypothetical protein